MFVVGTIPQMEEALRSRAREVMVVGLLAPQLFKVLEAPRSNNNGDLPINAFHVNLLKKFNYLAVYDSSQNVIATVLQLKNEHRQQWSDVRYPNRAGWGESSCK